MRKVEVIGHRGARSYAPENTLPSYKIGLSQGVDCIDVDVVLTKDDIFVAYHNLHIIPDILIKCDRKRPLSYEVLSHQEQDRFLIKNHTLTDLLSQYNVLLDKHSDYGKYFPHQLELSNVKIPTLQQVVDYANLLTSNQINFQIEIKTDFNHPKWSHETDKIVDLMYKFIHINNLFERVKIQAFDWEILVKLNALDMRIKTAYLEHRDKNSFKRFFTQEKMHKFLQGSGLDQSSSVFEVIKYLGGYSYEPEDVYLTKDDCTNAHKHGLKVFVWRYPEHSGSDFDPHLVHQLLDFGVDGFIIDDPLRLNNLLSKLGYSTPKVY